MATKNRWVAKGTHPHMYLGKRYTIEYLHKGEKRTLTGTYHDRTENVLYFMVGSAKIAISAFDLLSFENRMI